MTGQILEDRKATYGGAERRRPGRMANPSPELIALMRKPTEADRLKVALYDAPNFVLPPAQLASARTRGLTSVHFILAFTLCGGASAAMFKVMMWAWA